MRVPQKLSSFKHKGEGTATAKLLVVCKGTQSYPYKLRYCELKYLSYGFCLTRSRNSYFHGDIVWEHLHGNWQDCCGSFEEFK